MNIDKKLFPLSGKVQHYDWGGADFIPALLNIENKGRQPFAEYWLGSHDSAPSEVEINEIEFTPLNRLINANPELLLGKRVADQFNKLPFLLKILDVKKMLSIQVHPSKEDAEKGFARENAEKIPLHSPHRNYKDDNHKPELMVALSDFWLLHGFKSTAGLKDILQKTTELTTLLPVFDQSGYKGLYQFVMEMSADDVNNLLEPLLQRITPLYKQDKLKKDNEDFWAARAALTFDQAGKIDRGIFSVYFFNLLYLRKGEGIYQAAGVPHAYLEGQNVEIMANSDNVLRGGLTTKHIDVQELMKHVKFNPVDPRVVRATLNAGKKKYETPAEDFELSVVDMQPGELITFSSSTTGIIVIVQGSMEIKEKNIERLKLGQGQSVVLFAGAEVEVTSNENTQWYLGSVPVHHD